MNATRLPAFTLGIVLLALPVLAAAAPRSVPTGLLFKTLKQGGQEYRYSVFVPPTYDASRKWPLIVFLNGAGECGTDGAKSAAVGLGPAVLLDVASWPFIIVYPQKPRVDKQWEEYDDAVMAMVKQAEKDYKVDTRRLYLTGLSQGGHGTWVIGAKHADTWAAIAPICGYGNAEEIAPGLKSVPVWCFHGEDDPVVGVQQSRDITAAIQAAGGDVKLTTYPGVGHGSWDKAYRDEKLGEWFLQHERK